MTPVDITVTGEDFVSLNQEADIPVGTELQLQTKSNHPVIVQRKESKPSSEDNNGRVMKGVKNKSSIYQVKEGSEEVWLRLDTDNLLSSGKVSAGLVFGGEEPVVNYVARLSDSKYWELSSDITIPIETDFKLSAKGVFSSNGFYFAATKNSEAGRLAISGESRNVYFNNSNIGPLSVSDFSSLTDGSEHELSFSREGSDAVVLVDGLEVKRNSWSNSEFIIDSVGSRWGGVTTIPYLEEYVYNFKVEVDGIITNEIKLTNKDQGSTQTPNIGAVSATLIGYVGDEWEVNPNDNS